MAAYGSNLVTAAEASVSEGPEGTWVWEMLFEGG